MIWNIIITILIGALVGWLAGLIMKTNHGTMKLRIFEDIEGLLQKFLLIFVIISDIIACHKDTTE